MTARRCWVAVAVCALLPVACSGDSDDQPAASPASTTVLGASVVAVDGRSGRPGAPIAVGGDPLTLVVAGGRVWTLNFADGSLSRIDPATRQAEPVHAGVVVGLASDGADVWVTHDGERLSRLNAVTGAVEASFSLNAQPVFALRDAGFVGVGHGSVWVTIPVLGQANAAQSLWRVDAASGRVTARIPIGVDPRSPLVTGDHVWVVSAGSGRVTRVDPRTNEAVDAAAGSVPLWVEAGAGAIWIAHEGRDSQVWRIDPITLQPVAKVDIRGVARAMAFGDGRMWVATEAGLEAIDPATNEVARRIRLTDGRSGKGPVGIAVLDDTVWVSVE